MTGIDSPNKHVYEMVRQAFEWVPEDDIDIHGRTGRRIPPSGALSGGRVRWDGHRWIAESAGRHLGAFDSDIAAGAAVAAAVNAARYDAEVILWHYAGDMPEHLVNLARTPTAEFPWPDMTVETVQP